MICGLLWTFIIVGICWKAYQYFLWKECKPDFTGKTVFISGGSSGIGEALAKRVSHLGAKKIIIAARRLEELDRVRQACAKPELVETFQLDLN